MHEIKITFEFNDRQVADDVSSLLDADPEHLAPEGGSIRKAENTGDLMADDWHFLEYLIGFGAAAFGAAGKKVGEAVTSATGRLLIAVRNCLSQKEPNEDVDKVAHVEKGDPPKTSVTISIQEVTRTITITSESSSEALLSFAEEIGALPEE